ncbi:MAG: ribosome-associated translation inhibitor RaiA [Oscillospiraceae bacterium]|nr:ribosome-associated translation inhibitor RaiA [Oscillospiraceae bacterium]
MKFTFTNKKVELPKAVHAYAEKKFGKLDRYFNTDAEVSIVFSVEKDLNRVEATIRAGSLLIRASECTSDMYASIDAAVSFIERKLRKNKSRLEKRLRQGAFTRTVSPEDVSSFAPESPEDELSIVRTKRFPIKPMSCEEAVLQMNLLGHSFFAFKDETNDGAFAVVYKRASGDYGLIEDDD